MHEKDGAKAKWTKFSEDKGFIAILMLCIAAIGISGYVLSTYGLALVTDTFGWDATLVIWCVAAVIGTACCVLNIKRWKKYVESI